MRQLERELLKKQTRGRKAKKSNRSKKRVQSDSSCDSSDSSPESRSRLSSSSSDSQSRSPEKDRKPKYDRRHQIKKDATSLIVYLVKLLQLSYKRGKRVKGIISHLLVMSEKVESGYYKFECLVGYDDECREMASEKGMRSFGEIHPAAVLRFLSYDSTANAKRQQGGHQSQAQPRKQEARGSCFKFNASGCSSSNCQFQHACMFCGDGSHDSQSCRKGKSGPSGGNKGN